MTRYQHMSLCRLCLIVVILLESNSPCKVIADSADREDHDREKKTVAEGPMFEDLPLIMRKYSIPTARRFSSNSIPEPVSAMENIVDRNKHLVEANIPGFVEGDIYLGSDVAGNSPGNLRAALATEHRLWPNGIIPYTIDPYYDQDSVTKIENAMADFHRYTCIRFIPRSTEKVYIYITPLDGCWSGFGYGGRGAQSISLGNGCVWHATIIHELMHTLGFIHEQGRSDRDNYVRLLEENIIEGYVPQFGKVLDKVTTQGTPYDYDSLMHYQRTAFTKNGQPTIVAINDYNRELGTARTFSFWDFVEVNGIYNCGYDVNVWYENQKECIIDTNTDRRGGNMNDGNRNKMAATEDCCLSCKNTPGCKSFSFDKRPGSTHGNCWLKNDWISAWTDDCCDSGVIWPYPDEDDDDDDDDDDDNGGGGEEECTDNYDGCELWAAAGQCETNPDFMLQHCAKYCVRECIQEEICEDKVESCEAWASAGECDKNPTYMKVNCKKSCSVCQNECTDNYDGCELWAAVGQCETIPDFMLQHCAKYCLRDCIQEEICEDKDESCEAWASAGECDKNPTYMKVNCKKSCSVCQDDCSDNNDSCASWANKGECASNPTWMLANCKKSCRQC